MKTTYVKNVNGDSKWIENCYERRFGESAAFERVGNTMKVVINESVGVIKHVWLKRIGFVEN